MICKTCGGNRTPELCNICVMLEAQSPPLQAQHPAGWPMAPSEALAVHVDQRAEAAQDAKKKGVPTYFDRVGRPVFTDPGHHRRYLKTYGFHRRGRSKGSLGNTTKRPAHPGKSDIFGG